MHDLIDKMFMAAFQNPFLESRHDGATFKVPEGRMALTTDSYVVHPLFFPGGDIGKLAVCGTVNDLAMCGAKPFYLSCGFILEEGLEMETLWRVVSSMSEAAQKAQVSLVTGDTKVVDKGKGDGIFINTSGVGILEYESNIAPSSVRPGDKVIVNGDIGRHGMAIMAVREGLSFESKIESDVAPVAEAVMRLLAEGIEIHCLRDLTRGGMASALNEIAQSGKVGIHVSEKEVPVREDVRGACEFLGFDPLYVACEGRFVAFVPPSQEKRTLELMKSYYKDLGCSSEEAGNIRTVGEVRSESPGRVTMESRIGTNRILDILSGEQLPRIC